MKMAFEGLLAGIKFIVIGIISMLPTLPTVNISYLDGVFQALSVTDLIVNVKVLAVCLGVLFAFMSAQLIYGVIMWVVRKIPFLK